MKHSIPTEAFGAYGPPMSEAVQTCVHCGFCLTNCPTYRVLGQEMDSPRGRIILMKEVLEGEVPLDQALPHVDQCLGCLACETHCPSGVEYRELLSPFRDRAEDERSRPVLESIRRWFVLQTLPHPGRFRWAVRMGMLARRFAGLAPSSARVMLDLLPTELPTQTKLEPLYPAEGERRARVALLAGCAQQVLAPEINAATIAVLVRNGVEVVVPEAQGCCGALAWHVGEGDSARDAAAANLRAFPEDVDAIITNAAGCGSGLQEYPLMLKGSLDEKAAEQFSNKVVDVSVFLQNLGIADPPETAQPVTIAYHDACHLSHGQGVRVPPRDLLRRIPGVTLCEVPDGEICCGSAGTYNMDQPTIAAELGRQKAESIASTEPDYVALGNIGCLTQIDSHLRKGGTPIPVLHTIQLLDLAYRGQLGKRKA